MGRLTNRRWANFGPARIRSCWGTPPHDSMMFLVVRRLSRRTYGAALRWFFQVPGACEALQGCCWQSWGDAGERLSGEDDRCGGAERGWPGGPPSSSGSYLVFSPSEEDRESLTLLPLFPRQRLSEKLFSALKALRTALVKEAGEGVMAYHIFLWARWLSPFLILSLTMFGELCRRWPTPRCRNATLQQISKRLPRSKEELLEINGIGK